MLHPTIDELTKGKFNRYELALATARCARLITDEYVRQHDAAERAQTGNKETDRPINTMIDRELRDEKAVKVAIRRIANGDFIIDENAADYEPIDLAAEHEAAMQARYPDFSDDEEDDEDEDDAFAEDEDIGDEEVTDETADGDSTDADGENGAPADDVPADDDTAAERATGSDADGDDKSAAAAVGDPSAEAAVQADHAGGEAGEEPKQP